MEMENEQVQRSSQPLKVEAQPSGVEGAAPGNGLAVTTTPTAEKATEQPQKPKESLTAAEKLQLKEKAATALKQLTKEADRVTTAPDYFAALGFIPGQADVNNVDRMKSAFRERVQYFHPDKANRKVDQILGDVGATFPELADEAQKARLACEAATRKLTDAESFLKDDSRRAKYLGEKYGIQANVSEEKKFRDSPEPETEQSKQRTQATQRGSERTQPKPEPEFVQDARAGYAKGFQDWRDTYESPAWKAFSKVWSERQAPAQTTEKPKTAAEPPESLLNRIKETQGQRRLNEMIDLGVEAFNEVKDNMSLKFVLEVLVAIFEQLQAKYTLKQEKRGLPIDVVKASFQGMISRLNQRPDGNERWATKLMLKQKLQMMKSSAAIVLGFLKQPPPFSGPFGATA
jgi:hypothetical protein